MEGMIDNLIGAYESGRLSRRALVGVLAGLTFASSSAQAAAGGFEGNSLNHVNIASRDLEKSVEFYQRIFKLPVIMRAADTVQLGIGKGQHLSAAAPARDALAWIISPSGSTALTPRP